MRVLLDTNVLLDVLLDRAPWADAATALWRATDEGRLQGYVVASAMTDIFYIARRLKDVDTALEAVRLCLAAFDICPVDADVLERALEMPGQDFEDNVVVACAERWGLEAIITRNAGDFVHSPIPVWSPEEALSRLQNAPSDD